jgi:hypothetical protein
MRTRLLFLAALAWTTAPAQADLVWTGAASNDVFDEANWDLSGTTVTLVDANVSIDDDVQVVGAAQPLELMDLPGQGRFQLAGGRSLFLDGSDWIELGNDGIGGAPGATLGADIWLLNGSHLRTYFIVNQIRLHIGPLCRATFDGGGDPVNLSKVDMTAGATMVFTSETVTDFLNEHLSKTTVDGAPGVVGVNLQVVAEGAAGCRVTALSSFPTLCGGAAACPCGNSNDGSSGVAGCRNSASSGGAALAAGGSSSAGTGDLGLVVSGLPAGSVGVFFQGNQALNAGQGVLFGDGLRCVGQGVRRLEVFAAGSAGTAASTTNIAVRGAAAAGVTRHYQAWYSDPAGSPCGAGFNLSNALSVAWSL